MYQIGVFFTVVYPQALPFLKDVCESLHRQTNKQFDFLVINDGCDEDVLRKQLTIKNCIILNAKGSPAANRQQGIDYARNHGYKYILFCDADDSFSSNRYQRTVHVFEELDADIVVSNLNVVDKNLQPIINNYFSLELPADRWIDAPFIEDKNIFGMSNTAIKLCSLNKQFVIPETPIVDWYYYTILLKQGLKARFISESLINYRQHDNNLIGINRYDVALFKKQASLKAQHYSLLIQAGFSMYKDNLEKCKKLLFLPDEEIDRNIDEQLKKHKQPLWWQIITQE